MRRRSLLAVAALASAAVLAVAIRDQLAERRLLFEEFTRSQQSLAREVAADLASGLGEIDADARVVAGLVSRARGAGSDARHDDEVVLAAFEALAGVVRYYRCLALFDEHGSRRVSAVDPSERAATARWLLEEGAAAARVAARQARTALVGPVEAAEGGHFYFHASPLASGEIVVLVAEARVLLQTVLRPRAGQVRYAVLDPREALWLGCSQATTCRVHRPDAWRRNASFAELVASMSGPAGITWPAGELAQALRLPLRPLVVASQPVSSDGGRWSLAVIASAAALDARERALLRRLLVTSVGIVLSLGGLGYVFVRQQRRAVALEERLRHDQERRSLEDQLVRAEKLMTVGVLAAGIAHEIGTPLAIIRGRAEALLEKVSDPATATTLGAVIEQIDRISGTIRQVLDFARRQPLAVGPTAVADVAATALTLLDWRFRRKAVRAELLAEPALPPVAADADQLQQVLVNLLLNSCDACARGGSVRVRIARDPDTPGMVRIDVIDDGCGIPPENIEAVFDPFFTTKGRGEGTGLGLFVATNIVRTHGGKIRLESNPGTGTTATVHWPVAHAPRGGTS